MLDQGGCGYNNFEYVSVAKLKEVLKGGTREWADATPISFKIEYYII